MILVEPKVSTAGSFLIIACFSAISFVPTESTIVTIEDNASGMAATATAIANINELKIKSFKFPPALYPLKTSTLKITAAIIIIIIPNFFPKLSSLTCKGVCFVPALSRSVATLPTSVFIPVAVTIMVPLP